MDLRKATLLLILGLAYTLVHKALGLFPSVAVSPLVSAVTNIAWLIATATLVLFAYQFLVEIRPHDAGLRGALIAIAVCTTLVIISRLPYWPPASVQAGTRLLFRGASLLNGLAMLCFAICLVRIIPPASPLRTPLQALIGALMLTAILGLIAGGYQLLYMLTGVERGPASFLPPLAAVSFLLTYGISLWFLISLWRQRTYADLLQR